MNQAYPDITPEVKERLHAQGLKPYKLKELSDFVNPYGEAYWITNAMITAAAVYGRYHATRNSSARYMYSVTIIAIPLLAIAGKVKLEGVFSYGGHRRTLEERLDYSPVTRRAWARAMQENDKYQQELRTEIEQYDTELSQRSK